MQRRNVRQDRCHFRVTTTIRATGMDTMPTGFMNNAEPILGRQAHLLRNHNFILLWCAYGVSAMGDHLSEMAILKTQNALNPDVDIAPLSARMMFMFFVPFFLLGPLTGALADRYPRRTLMVVADISRAALLLPFAALIAWTTNWGSWGPFYPLLVVGLFAAIFSPARMAMLPTIIRPNQLVRANGLIGGLGVIATMIAAWVGGILADRYHPEIAFRANTATFAVSAVLLLLMKLPRSPALLPTEPNGPSTFKKIIAGFRYARQHRRVMELLVIAGLVWFCGPLVNSVIPAVVRDVYHGAYSMISGYRALLGLGFILGATVITVLGDALRSEIAMTWGLFGISAGMAVFAISASLSLDPTTLSRIGGVGIVISGMCALAVMASFQTLLQRITADRFRGRVFGVKDLVCTAALLLATGTLGIPQWTRVDRWAGAILGAVALIMFVAGMVTVSIRLRRGPHRWMLNFCENLNSFVVKFWYRFQCIGRPTVPRTGPVIVTANHIGPADPLLLSAGAPYRAISFMIAAEYAKWPIVRFFTGATECIPVRRGTRETTAIKQALRHLEKGKAIAIFIEGGINPPGTPPRLKDGVAMLALRTGAVVIPAYISGIRYFDGIVRGLFARHHARVRFGPPVNLDEFRTPDASRETVRAATRKIYSAVLALGPQPPTVAASDVPHTDSDVLPNPDQEDQP